MKIKNYIKNKMIELNNNKIIITEEIIDKMINDLKVSFDNNDIVMDFVSILEKYKYIISSWGFEKFQMFLFNIINENKSKTLEMIVEDMNPEEILKAMEENAEKFAKLAERQIQYNQMLKDVFSILNTGVQEVGSIVLIALLRSILPVPIPFP